MIAIEENAKFHIIARLSYQPFTFDDLSMSIAHLNAVRSHLHCSISSLYLSPSLCLYLSLSSHTTTHSQVMTDIISFIPWSFAMRNFSRLAPFPRLLPHPPPSAFRKSWDNVHKLKLIQIDTQRDDESSQPLLHSIIILLSKFPFACSQHNG